MLDPNDNGMMSRKYHAFLGCVLAIVLGGVASSRWPAFQTSYATYCGALVALFSIYCGMNIAQKVGAGTINGKYFSDKLPPTQPGEEEGDG